MKGIQTVLRNMADIRSSIIMCKSPVLSIILLVLLALSSSCQEKQDGLAYDAEKNFKKIFFDEKLASISADPNGKYFYLCTENGSIFKYNGRDSLTRIKTQAKFERIYMVYCASTSSIYICSRNKGLYKCRLNGDVLDTICSFTIPKRGSKYSVYDMAILRDSLFAATSHGLYAIDCNNNTHYELTEKWSSDRRIKGEPVVVGNLCTLDDKLYFTSPGAVHILLPDACDSVIIKCNNKSDPLLCKTKKDTIKALIGDSLYIVNVDSPSNSAKFIGHHCIDFLLANDNIYLVTNNDSIYVNRRGSRLPWPACDGRNLLANDPLHQQAILISQHAVVRLPYHYLQPSSDCVNVAASCVDPKDNTAFFLIDSKIFKLCRKDSVLKETKLSLPSGCHTTLMTCLDGKIYYMKENDLYCLDPREKIISFEKSPTAITSFNGRIYIGIRDAFYVVNVKDKTKELVNLIDEKQPVNFPFLTAFATKNDTTLLIGTLNDGIFSGSGKDNNFYRDTLNAKANNPKFIRDILHDNEAQITYILTNNQLFACGRDGSIDTIAEGYSRLLPYPNGVVAIKDFGIMAFTKGTTRWSIDYFYQDWAFLPDKSVYADKMLLVREDGIFLIKKFEEKLNWLPVERRQHLDWSYVLFGICGVAILALLSALWLYYKRHHHLNLDLEESEGTITRLEDEKSKLENEKTTEIGALKTQIDAANEDVSRLTDEKAELENKMNSKIETLKTQLNAATDDVSRLTGEKAKLEKEKNSEIETLNTKLEAANAHAARLTDEKSALEKTKEDLGGKLEQSTTEKKELIESIIKLFDLLNRDQLQEILNYGSIKQQIEEALASKDIIVIKDRISYFENLIDTDDNILEFKKAFNNRQQKFQYIENDDSLRKLSIIKQINELMQIIEKPEKNSNSLIEKNIAIFNNTPLSPDEITKVFSINDIKKLLHETDSSFQKAKEVLEQQVKKYERIMRGFKPDKPKGWQAIDYLIDEVYTLKIRHDMAKGFIHLNKMFKDDLANEETSILKKFNSRDDIQINIEKYAAIYNGKIENMKKDQREVIEFLKKIDEQIRRIYEPWFKTDSVDSELWGILTSNGKRDFFRGKKMNIQGATRFLFYAFGDFANNYKYSIINILSIKYGSDEENTYNTIISKSTKNKELQKKISEYFENNPDSIARFFMQ